MSRELLSKKNSIKREIDNWVNLRHKPNVERFKETKKPLTFDIFDWVIWSPFDKSSTRTNIKDPKLILCLAHSHSINFLLDHTEFNSKPVLVIAGEDTNLTPYKNVFSRVANRFSKIYFEAKDIDHPYVDSFAMGFNSYYLNKSNIDNICGAIAHSTKNKKEHLILAAWGKEWPHLDKQIDDRKSADQFLKSNTFVNREIIQFDKYWQTLAKYHFLIAPRGQGIQSPKLAEAWMVRTIPIVTEAPCFVDLKKQGFPLIIIKEWQEVTPLNIDTWLKQYSMVDWNKVNDMLTNHYFKDFLLKQYNNN